MIRKETFTDLTHDDEERMNMLNRLTGMAAAISLLAVVAALAFALDAPRWGLTLVALAVAGLPVLLVVGLRRQSTQLRAALSDAGTEDGASLRLPPGDERDATAQLRLVVAQLAADEIALSSSRARVEARLDELERRMPPGPDAS